MNGALVVHGKGGRRAVAAKGHVGAKLGSVGEVNNVVDVSPFFFFFASVTTARLGLG
jgi:hypothetical protein